MEKKQEKMQKYVEDEQKLVVVKNIREGAARQV